MATKKKTVEVDPVTGEVVDDPMLPWFECAENISIEKAARRFSIRKQEAKDAKEAADIAQESLVELMHEHSVTYYKKHGIQVTLDTREKAIVQIVEP